MEALRIISQDHSNLWRLATTIDLVAEEIEGGEPLSPAFFTSVFDYIERFVDHFHHPKEDDFLFRILRLRSDAAAAILDPLQQEHQDGPERLLALRAQLAQAALSPKAVPEFLTALRAFTVRIKDHIRVEEKSAMPLARAVLTAQDWAEIDHAFLDNDD
ncbi:MAG: hemerythrin domain-containing protein, partial [Rhodoferax sp.]|nr:hemerythrin domain-containing protein [Rhodoferax sp.]